jgi:hypothetical protein
MHILSAFIDGYYNGFVVAQTPIETIADWIGNAVWTVLQLL